MLPSKKLNIHIFNLSIRVTLSLKLIVQVTFALIYGTLFNTYACDFTAHTCSKNINKWIIIYYERTRIITSVANSIPSKHLKFALKCLEINLTQWTKCKYRELRVLAICNKKVFTALTVVTNNICFCNMIFSLTFIEVWLTLIQKSKHC